MKELILDHLVHSTFVIAASDRYIDPADYKNYMKESGIDVPAGYPSGEAAIDTFLSMRNPILLPDDHVLTDILVAPLIGRR